MAKSKNKYEHEMYVGGNMVTVIGRFAGRDVRGTAKCSPNDSFDLNTGINLATARCDYKIAQKRMKSAIKKYQEAMDATEAAKKFESQMAKYFNDASLDLEDAETYLKDITDMTKEEE